MRDCVFCQIGRSELPAYFVYRDENYDAFLDIRPLNPGHTLVVPKEHYRWVWDVPDIGRFFQVTTRVAKVLQMTMKTDWIAADVAGMGVPHAHIHLVPRFPDDGHGEFVNGRNVKPKSADKMNEIAEKIRKAMHETGPTA